jgi:predicted RNase H-like HicB family nuclease
MKKKTTRVIRKSDGWYVAYVKEIPGVNTQGRSLAEARSNLKEALALITEVRAQLRLSRRRKRGSQVSSGGHPTRMPQGSQRKLVPPKRDCMFSFLFPHLTWANPLCYFSRYSRKNSTVA